MSCLHFNTDAQMQQLELAKLSDEPIASWLSPEVNDSKLERIRRMARHGNYRIRESAALSINLPEDAALVLAADDTASVRICLARNSNAPVSVLRVLAHDKSATVRCWVVVNPETPLDVIDILINDSNIKVKQFASLYKERALSQ